VVKFIKVVIAVCAVGIVAVIAIVASGGTSQTPAAAPATSSNPSIPSSASPATPSTPIPSTTSALTNEDWGYVLTEAMGAGNSYIGSPVRLTGKIGQVVGRAADETQIAIETDFTQELSVGKRTLVVISGAVSAEEGDYVRVEGTLNRYWSTTNLIGAELTLPVVVATSVVTISRSEAIPAIVTVNLDETLVQHDLSITLDRIEIAASETRVFVQASNDGATKASLYSFDAVLVQGRTQVQLKTVWGEADIVEPDTSLIPGTATSGVLMFEPLDPASHQARLLWAGPRSENWELEFTDWEWEFSW